MDADMKPVPDVEAAALRAAEKIRRVIYKDRNIHPDRTAAIIAREFAPLAEALVIEAKKVCWLEGKLAEFQESEFHPDWSLLKASRDSVKEHQTEIRRLQLRIDSARDILRWGAADPQKTVIAAYRELDAAPAGPDKERGDE